MRTLLTRSLNPNAGGSATGRALITAVLASVFVAAGPVPSMAQMATPSFDDLRAEGQLGKVVYLTDQGGTTVKGRVARISTTSIALLVEDASREWLVSDVARITQHRRHAILGAEVGLSVGLGLAALLVLTDPYCRESANANSDWCGPEAMLIVGGFFGGIGAGAGAAIGAAIRTERVLYAAPRSSAHVFSLRVGPGMIGMNAQLQF